MLCRSPDPKGLVAPWHTAAIDPGHVQPFAELFKWTNHHGDLLWSLDIRIGGWLDSDCLKFKETSDKAPMICSILEWLRKSGTSLRSCHFFSDQPFSGWHLPDFTWASQCFSQYLDLKNLSWLVVVIEPIPQKESSQPIIPFVCGWKTRNIWNLPVSILADDDYPLVPKVPHGWARWLRQVGIMNLASCWHSSEDI